MNTVIKLVSYNRQFANGIGNLTNQGIIVLGYVFTGYGNPHYNDNVHCCPYGTPQGNVTQWATMYGPQNATFASKGIKGILFDGMNYPGSGTTTGTETYYQNLTSYAKNIEGFTYTIGNPGSPTGTNYVNSGAADTIDIFEQQNAIPNIQNDLVPDTFANLGGVNYGFDKHDFSFLTYNQTSLPPSTTIGNQSNYVGLMFYSNTTSCCPFDVWGKIPPYLSNLTAILDKKTSEITINSTGPSGPVTGLLVQISQNGTVVPSGYTPYSYLGTQGVKYTFTPQNSAACTFDHWRDTSSGTAARAITVNSTSKAFTVVYTGTNCK